MHFNLSAAGCQLMSSCCTSLPTHQTSAVQICVQPHRTVFLGQICCLPYISCSKLLQAASNAAGAESLDTVARAQPMLKCADAPQLNCYSNNT
jgi:hypothetical protein